MVVLARRMNERWTWRLPIVLIVAVCAKAPAEQSLTLGSGKSVEILAVGPLQSTQGWTGLMLKYRTSIPLNELTTLRKEADEIWDRFVVDAEHRGYQTAIVSANEPEHGSIVTTNDSFNFVFEKKDGSWRTLESGNRARTKLDPAFIRGFMDRLDWAFENNEMNALLLYMANDWKITIVNPAGSNPASQTFDRMKFVTVTHATFAAAANRQHRREILNLSITDGGTEARVESRETTDLILNAHHATDVERSTDTFELRDGVMLWTGSTDVIEKLTGAKGN